MAYELQAAKIQQKIRNEEIQIQVKLKTTHGRKYGFLYFLPSTSIDRIFCDFKRAMDVEYVDIVRDSRKS